MNTSLRSLGGTGSQHKIDHEDPKMSLRMQQVVDSTPEAVADIIVNPDHELYDAMKELLRLNMVTAKQYGILGDELIRRKTPTSYQNPVLRVIVHRTSSEITGKIYDALGWNKHPREGDDSLAIVFLL